MASSDIRMRVEQVGLDRSMEEAYNRGARRIRRRPLRINVDTRSFEQPLGRITGQMSEFQKSMDASVARVFAFGAAVSVINGVQQAFKSLVKESIAVEKALADINVLLGLSAKNIQQFGSNLFTVARNTAQSFDTISTAASEFARQGLTAEQTLKRVNDAMVLTRLSGLDAASSVKTLTAAVNSFTNEALKSVDVVNRLANVDAAFAVSSKDLADSLARAGAAAQSAGVEFNELLAITTAVQQRTARGGAVIGNAFKTIFTRLQRSNIRGVLEDIGIATQNLDGTFRSSAAVLQDYANVYNRLSDAQKAYTSEQIAGVRQVNILKSLIGDMGNRYSIFNRALGTANRTTDQAIKRNEQLNKTMAALATQTALSVQELAASLGQLTMNEGVQRVLGVVKTLSDGLNKLLDPQSGSTLIQGFFKGIGAFIAGPGLVLIGGAFLKIFKIVGKLGLDAGKSLFGLNKEAERQKNIQMAILNLLAREEGMYQKLMSAQGNSAKQEQIILNTLRQQTAERARQQKFLTSLAGMPGIRNMPLSRFAPPTITPGRAGGYVPQGSPSALSEKARAAEGGYKAGRVVSMNMPSSGKPIVYNLAEQVKYMGGFKDPFINPPENSRAGQSHKANSISKTGINPYSAMGHVPNLRGLSLEERESRLRNVIKVIKNNPGVSLQKLLAPANRQLYFGGKSTYSGPQITELLKVAKGQLPSQIRNKKGTLQYQISPQTFDGMPGSLKGEFSDVVGTRKLEGTQAKSVAYEKYKAAREDLEATSLEVGRRRSAYISLGGANVTALPGSLSTKFISLASSARKKLEAREGGKIGLGSPITLKPAVEFASSVVSPAEFADEVKSIITINPKTKQPNFNTSKTAALAAKLFPSTGGVADDKARQNTRKSAKQIIQQALNQQKKTNPNRQQNSAKFLAGKMGFNKKGQSTGLQKGNTGAAGWIFEKLNIMASEALSGAALSEMKYDTETWDLPNRLAPKYRDYYNVTSGFGDYKVNRDRQQISSFIGKHIRKPGGGAGAEGFVPNLAGGKRAMMGAMSASRRPDTLLEYVQKNIIGKRFKELNSTLSRDFYKDMMHGGAMSGAACPVRVLGVERTPPGKA